MEEQWIEVFRTGRHTDMGGNWKKQEKGDRTIYLSTQ
jgi:hypothetical protein